MEYLGVKIRSTICKYIVPISFIVLFPIVICFIRFLYDKKFGDFDPNWLSFWGSYLGGLIGGIATLLAVVVTINNNKEEQDRKEEKERQKIIQKSALIVYYDFHFALKNIVSFVDTYRWAHLFEHIEDRYQKVDIDTELYYKYTGLLDQFYFNDEWNKTVAELNRVSLNDQEYINIERIYEIYGHFMTIKKSLEVYNLDQSRIQNICDNAFDSMISLIDISGFKDNEKGIINKLPSEIVIADDIKQLMKDLKTLSTANKG